MKTKYPKVTCARCGNCCRVPEIPITHKDLARLVKHTGKTAERIVRLCPDSEMEFDEESGLWITMKSSKRAMVLRKRLGRCMFQTPERTCSVYEARPMTCRTFPYSVYFEDGNYKNGDVEEITLNKVLKCGAKKCREIDLAALVQNVRKENREDREYHRLVGQWNKSQEKGSASDFLQFIGF